MAIAELYSGSASISTTEFSLVSGTTTLQSDTTDGVFQVMVDFTAMTASDAYTLTVKEKVISSAAQEIVYNLYLEGTQSTPIVLPSLIFMHGWDVTVRRTAGADRTIVWSIRQVA